MPKTIDSAEEIYRIALTLVPNVGPKTTKQLISYCGSAKSVFNTPQRTLQNITGIGPQTAKFIHQKSSLQQAEKEYEYLINNNIQLLFFTDSHYPTRLKYQSDSPALLYYKGNIDLNAQKVIAIVGTRQPSIYGRELCEKLIEAIKKQDILVVSGLAYGIDAIAHRKCVDLNMQNLAILGHGMRTVYPAAHKTLAKQIIQNGGMITEYISTMKPEREHFPMRNRIIAGLCDALIVIETGQKGGSIISANIANAYHKDVFAFPGRVNDAKSAGCNQLIKEHKAAMIEHAEDLFAVMRWSIKKKISIQPSLFTQLSDEEKLIVRIFENADDLHIDYLANQLNLTGSRLSAILLNLEFKGILRALPGKLYRRM